MATIKLQHPHFQPYIFTAWLWGWKNISHQPYQHQKDIRFAVFMATGPVLWMGPSHTYSILTYYRRFDYFGLHSKSPGWCQRTLSLTSFTEGEAKGVDACRAFQLGDPPCSSGCTMDHCSMWMCPSGLETDKPQCLGRVLQWTDPVSCRAY